MTNIPRFFKVSAFIAATFLNFSANAIRVPGSVSGFSIKDKDGVVDAAIVIPTLAPTDIFNFDLDSLLGPDEKADAGPISTDVPGNTFIPSQKEKYGWFTITLKKEEFGFYTERYKQDELSTLWFSAPMQLLIDASKDKASASDLIRGATFQKAGFLGLNDWSKIKYINSSLDQKLNPTGRLNWYRSKPSENHADIVISFQNTPANRWALSGFDGNPSSSIKVTSIYKLENSLKVLALRSRFENNSVRAATGWIVTTDKYSTNRVDNLPPELSSVRLSSNKVSWKNPSHAGLMAIVHSRAKSATRSEFANGLLKSLFPFTNLFSSAHVEPSLFWALPEAEEFRLSNVGAGDKISLIFVGTSKAVPIPEDNNAEPEVFTFANQIRSTIIEL